MTGSNDIARVTPASRPMVSVIVPFHNRIDWLRESIKSVLGQTWEDFELLLIDDGSDDPDVSRLELEDVRIRYARQDHKGRSAARNHGIAMARGPLIAFLDADDVFMPIKLERQVALLQVDHDCLMSHTSYVRMSPDGMDIGLVASGRFTGAVYPGILRRCPIATPTVMVRKEILDQGFRFDESLNVGEDIALWAEIARRAPVLGIDERLTRVRVHASNTADDRRAQISAQLHVVRCIIRKDSDLPWTVRRKLESYSYLDIAYSYWRLKKPVQLMSYLVSAIIAWPLSLLLEVLAYPIRAAVRRVAGREGADL